MKRSILLVAAVFFLSLTAAFAQAQRDTTQTQQGTEQQGQDATSQDPTKDMVQITSRDLPAPVQETLKSSTYKGWESGEIYRSENSDRFMVRINDGTGANPKMYYFDKNGRPIQTP
jgi:hypothetical protein